MTTEGRFADTVVLVTGGASGIGRAILERAAREGAKVAIIDKNGEGAMRLAEALQKKGHGAVGLAGDITDADAIANAVEDAVRALGDIGVLVNNAGGTSAQTFDDMDPAHWRADVELNLNGAYFVTRAAVPSMLRRGGGAIVNVATVNGLTSISEPAYSAAKAGLIQFTRQLAVEYGPRGIRANTVIPGSIRTPIWDHRLKDRPNLFGVLQRWYPVGRIGVPDDIAAAVLFLSSAEAGFINGASLVVDGGLMAGLPQMTHDIHEAG
ncbi:MAG: glucose 1-dehydrogenase [Methylobacteriaceae bacterium]|nr:glucose 1-dehydrogenase [Methylobacteriaceae bacterium]MBV9702723.1 glucose 1-dehydrogenase [Methylobacteriaceae bacterium]